MKIDTIYEDDDIVAFNKPSGLLTIPHRFKAEEPSLVRIAEKKYGKLFVIHRIDRDTSGAIILAKNEEAHRHYSMAFQNRQVEKYYRAFCYGNPLQDEGDIQTGIMEHPTIKGKMVINKKGKDAHTSYKILHKWQGYTFYDVQIHTGRTHQIRLHLQSIGTPIICDDVYGNGEPLKLSDFKKKYNAGISDNEERGLINRLALHSYQLKLIQPQGSTITITAEVPKDFSAAIKQLDKWGHSHSSN